MTTPNVATERRVAPVGSTTPVRLTVVVEWPVGLDLQELLDALPEEFAGAECVEASVENQCRECGCTDSNACTSPLEVTVCGWAEPGLCTFCAESGGGS